MNTAPLYTYAGTYRVDTVVVRLNGNLGTLTGDTGNLLNGNQSVIDFGHFHLEQTLQEYRRCTGKDNLRIVILVVHTGHHGTRRFSLAIEIARNLFRLGQQQFVSFIVEQQHFLLPYLVYFRIDDITHLINIFIIDTVFFQFQNFRGQRLTQVQDGTSSEVREDYFIRHFLAHFIRSIYFLCFR